MRKREKSKALIADSIERVHRSKTLKVVVASRSVYCMLQGEGPRTESCRSESTERSSRLSKW